ncbi:MAG: 4Fe-4S dicluster domain-containing protein [Ignavibacteriaceae bacterium]|nr:4Fe-4S dicluster domain-containing protein [Ignavibacteriaceae bacterium]
MKALRKARIITQILFFAPLFFIFIDFTGITGEYFKNLLTSLQFIPSIIKFLTIPSLLAGGFILILLLTIISGRAYCSTICPLGILQDIAGYLKRKLFSRNRFDFKKPHKVIRYGLLVILLISLVSGTMAAVNLFDPFSLFGRITFQIFRPLSIGVNNVISFVLSRFGNYSVYPQEFYFVSSPVLAFTAFCFIGITVLAVYRGRWYCNVICPVGTFLGLISKFSIYKFEINHPLCTECGACGKMCKSECIDTEKKIIDMERCVVCFNCTTVCNSSAITLTNRYRREGPKFSSERRVFINKLGSFLPGLLLFYSMKDSIIVYVLNKIPVIRKTPVTPPGAVSLNHFTSRCTACGLCVSTCPTHVIQPALFAYGTEGALQPVLDFEKSFCNYECNLCTLICPTGALLPMGIEAKKVSQLGKAVFIKDNCVVITQKTECGACSEHCPTKAVTMIPYEGLMLPEVREKYCVGCGACEKACPTKPYKSIYVEGNAEHKIAEKNLEKKKIKEEKVLEEFPF